MKAAAMGLAAVVAIAGCKTNESGVGRPALNSDTAAGVPAVYATLQRPTTPYEILENAKLACDLNLASRQDFFTDARILQFSGGERVTRSLDVPGHLVVNVDGFRSIAPPGVRVGGPGARVYASGSPVQWIASRWFREPNDMIASLFVAFGFSDPAIRSMVVIALWGPGWRLAPPPALPPHDAGPMPTDPLGNGSIEYVSNSAGAKRTVAMAFSSDGTLSSLQCSHEIQGGR